jgi:hypothetical protein
VQNSIWDDGVNYLEQWSSRKFYPPPLILEDIGVKFNRTSQKVPIIALRQLFVVSAERDETMEQNLDLCAD